MIVEPIEDLIEQELLVGHNHGVLVSFYNIIHDAVLIFCFWQRKYVRDAPVVKPYSYKPGEGCLRPGDPCSCIAVYTNEPPTCIVDVLYYLLVHYAIYGGMTI